MLESYLRQRDALAKMLKESGQSNASVGIGVRNGRIVLVVSENQDLAAIGSLQVPDHFMGTQVVIESTSKK